MESMESTLPRIVESCLVFGEMGEGLKLIGFDTYFGLLNFGSLRCLSSPLPEKVMLNCYSLFLKGERGSCGSGGTTTVFLGRSF